MLNKFTWQGYWTTLALLSATYYLVIYLLYYRNDFKMIVAKRKVPFIQQNSPILKPMPDNKDASDNNDQLVYACIDELNAYLEGSKSSKVVKEEFIFAVRRILARYPLIKDSEFKESISNLIVSEAQHNCSLQLNDEDMVHVWLE